MGRREFTQALPAGTVLHGMYRLGSVLGAGGFGITYEGEALADGKTVAVKEFFPVDYAVRDNAHTGTSGTGSDMHIFCTDKKEFGRGLRRFLTEAQTLRDFQYLDGIVTVLDCFEEHGTAYIVMEYIESITMKQYVRYNGCLKYEELTDMLAPVMRAMVKIHKRGILHRDISPENLLFDLNNEAHLIDFGSVYAMGEVPEHTRTIILKNGYAPPEQYLVEGDQGPWTDVYAMAATIYMGVTGCTPVDSVARLQGEELPVRCLREKGLLPWQIEAILTGMELKISKRYKNMEELLDALTIPPSAEDELTYRRSGHRPEKGLLRRSVLAVSGKKAYWRNLGLVCGTIVMAALFIIVFFYPGRSGGSGQSLLRGAAGDAVKVSTGGTVNTLGDAGATESSVVAKGGLHYVPDVSKMPVKKAVDSSSGSGKGKPRSTGMPKPSGTGNGSDAEKTARPKGRETKKPNISVIQDDEDEDEYGEFSLGE